MDQELCGRAFSSIPLVVFNAAFGDEYPNVRQVRSPGESDTTGGIRVFPTPMTDIGKRPAILAAVMDLSDSLGLVEDLRVRLSEARRFL